MPQNFFLVLEGLDGSGKSEISRRLADLLGASLGADRVLGSYEPHNPSAAGDFCRDVLAKRITVSARTLALAFALNRADHNDRVIAPFLNGGDGRALVCDRYYLSSLVYQSTGGLSVDDVMDLNRAARRPDLTLFLDASPETCYQRIGARQDHRELFEERLAERRAKYVSVIDYLRARGERIELVDANGGVSDVLNGVIAALNQHAPEWLRLDPVAEDFTVVTVLKPANLALAFLLELAALAAFADWGLGAGQETLVKIMLGVGTPVLAAVLWGIFAAPNSKRRLHGVGLLAFKLIFFALAALALLASGQAALALVFAVLVIMNMALIYAWQQEIA